MEWLTKSTFPDWADEVFLKLSILYLQFFPSAIQGRTQSLWRNWLIDSIGWGRFVLLDEWRTFAILLLFWFGVILFREQHLAKPDALYDIFWDNAHLLALEGVVQEKNISLLLFKTIHLGYSSRYHVSIVLDHLDEIALAVVDIPETHVTGKKWLDVLFPLVDALDAVYR